MFKTLDRYIIRQFLGTFLFIQVLIMAIAVVFDISEKTEDFAKATVTFHEIVVDYYINFVLYYSNLFSGLLLFIAVLLFTSRMANRSEIIATLSSGVSYPRFIRPYFIAATVVTLFSLYINVFLLPIANRSRIAFEKQYIWSDYKLEEDNVMRDLGNGTIVYFERVDMPRLTGYRFSLEQWDEEGRLRAKLLSDRATFDTVSGKWTVYDYVIRTIPLNTDSSARAVANATVVRGGSLDTLIALKAADLGQRLSAVAALDRHEIQAYIDAEKARGGKTAAFYEVERDQRMAYPFSTYVFTLIGVGVASRKVRGGTGVHLVLGVVLCLIYVFTMKITTVASTNSSLNPTLAVWLPNILFGAIGVWIYAKAPK